MTTDIMAFVERLSMSQASIPPVASRIAGFVLLVQAVVIFLQKKYDPHKSVWEEISGVLLAGLVVFLFPELIRFVEVLVNSAVPIVDRTAHRAFAEAVQNSLLGDGIEAEEASSGFDWNTLAVKFALMNQPGTSTGSYLIANYLLKPLADIVNTLCFPTYMFIRGAGLRVCYLIAPFVLMLGAFPPFRALWKQWFAVYISLLVCGPALILANDFCEEAFAIYLECTDSPTLGFIMVALARFKIFQSIMDLSHRIFRA